jgi:hypothetical protein
MMSHLAITKITLSFFITSLLLLLGCSKDNSIEDNTNSLIGKWTLISYEISNFDNTGETVDDSQKEAERPVFEFIDGDILIYNLGGKTKTLSFTLQGNMIKFNNAIAFETHDSFEYTFVSNQLILKRKDIYTFNSTSYTEETTIKLLRL